MEISIDKNKIDKPRKPLKALFSSVNSVLVEDGKNKIDEIKHFEYKNLLQQKDEALNILNDEGFIVLRNLIDKRVILEASNFLESYLSDLGITENLNCEQRKLYRTQILSGCLDVNQNPTFM